MPLLVTSSDALVSSGDALVTRVATLLLLEYNSDAPVARVAMPWFYIEFTSE